MEQAHAKRTRIGVTVFVLLAVLTIIEYIIAVNLTGTVPYLAVIALLKAGLIVSYFMHIKQLRSTEAH